MIHSFNAPNNSSEGLIILKKMFFMAVHSNSFFFNAAYLLPDYFFLEQRNDIIGLVRHTLHHRCYFYAEELARLFHVHAG